MDDELYSALYGTRLLIFLEEGPQSNLYRQVLLDTEEFKQASLAIGKVVEQRGHDQTVKLELSEETYTLPDLAQVNEAEDEEV